MSSSAEQIHASETPNAHIERRPVFKLTHQEAARFDSASGLFGLSIGRPIHLLYASGVHGVRVCLSVLCLSVCHTQNGCISNQAFNVFFSHNRTIGLPVSCILAVKLSQPQLAYPLRHFRSPQRRTATSGYRLGLP